MINAHGIVALLAELGAHTPALPNALCRNHTALFDREDAEGIAEAITLCGRCSDRQPCAAWAASMNPNRLFGVIAGRRYSSPNQKRGTTP